MADVLLGIRSGLVGINGWSVDQIVVSLEPDPPYHAQADWYASVRPRGGGPVPDRFGAAGRFSAVVIRRVVVTVRSRCALDEADRDLAKLTDLNLGHLRNEHAVINLLDGYQPVDASGNWLLVEPMRLVPGGISDPRRLPKEPEWVESSTEYEVQFELNLDQSQQ